MLSFCHRKYISNVVLCYTFFILSLKSRVFFILTAPRFRLAPFPGLTAPGGQWLSLRAVQVWSTGCVSGGRGHK